MKAFGDGSVQDAFRGQSEGHSTPARTPRTLNGHIEILLGDVAFGWDACPMEF